METYLFGIEFGKQSPWHVLGQGQHLHVLADGTEDDGLKGIPGMTRAELSRMAVVREWHGNECAWLDKRMNTAQDKGKQNIVSGERSWTELE